MRRIQPPNGDSRLRSSPLCLLCFQKKIAAGRNVISEVAAATSSGDGGAHKSHIKVLSWQKNFCRSSLLFSLSLSLFPSSSSLPFPVFRPPKSISPNPFPLSLKLFAMESHQENVEGSFIIVSNDSFDNGLSSSMISTAIGTAVAGTGAGTGTGAGEGAEAVTVTPSHSYYISSETGTSVISLDQQHHDTSKTSSTLHGSVTSQHHHDHHRHENYGRPHLETKNSTDLQRASIILQELESLATPRKIFENWARTFRCVPEQYFTPSSEEDVIKVKKRKNPKGRGGGKV